MNHHPYPGLLPDLGSGRRWLVVVAARLEAEAVLRGLTDTESDVLGPDPVDWRAKPAGKRFDLLLCGVGKANAAGAVGRAMVEARHGGILSIGIGGGLGSTNVGDVVVACESVFGDEGAERVSGWETSAAFGFPAGAGLDDRVTLAASGMGLRCDERITADLRETIGSRLPEADANARVHSSGVATVSTCSATNARAQAVLERTGAAAEAMEGAAALMTAKRLHGECRVVELRVISNRTGNEAAWDLDRALGTLTFVSSLL